MFKKGYKIYNQCIEVENTHTDVQLTEFIVPKLTRPLWLLNGLFSCNMYQNSPDRVISHWITSNLQH